MGLFQKQIDRIRREKRERDRAERELVSKTYERAEAVSESIMSDLNQVGYAWEVGKDAATVRLQHKKSGETIEIICRPDSFDIRSQNGEDRELSEEQMAERMFSLLGITP